MKHVATPSSYDCTRCGACCVNPPDNVAEGFHDYIEIEERDAIRDKPELIARYAQESEGKLHLKLLADQRCKALLGSVGRRVRCAIYHVRPSPCRRVQAGSALCERYRRGQGL